MAVCACAAPALADDTPNLLTAPFTVSLGTFILNTDPKVQLNGDTTTGDTIDFNKTAKGSSASRFRIDGAWRFGDTDRHRLKGFVFNISRSRSETIDQDIVWGDNTYPLDAKVDFKYGFTTVELAYEYEFLKRDTWEIGASAGVHYAQFRAELHAKAVDSNGTLDFDQSNKASVDAPLPVFGLQGTWQLPANLWLNVSGQWFALSIDEYLRNAPSTSNRDPPGPPRPTSVTARATRSRRRIGEAASKPTAKHFLKEDLVPVMPSPDSCRRPSALADSD